MLLCSVIVYQLPIQLHSYHWEGTVFFCWCLVGVVEVLPKRFHVIRLSFSRCLNQEEHTLFEAFFCLYLLVVMSWRFL